MGMDENHPKPPAESTPPSTPETPDRSDRHEQWTVGNVTITASFETQHGIEIPWATRARITTTDNEIIIEGRNQLATAFVVADALRRNPMTD